MASEERSDWQLSRIATDWELVICAHQGDPVEASAAQAALLGRYSEAVHRFLLRLVGDEETARELVQEFAVRFLRGDFHRADPARGRFRDLLKQALRNLMIDRHRARRSSVVQFTDNPPQPIDDRAPPTFDALFLSSWRNTILARAWASLKTYQDQTGRPYYTALHVRSIQPDLRAPELARRFSADLRKPVSPGWVRQTLYLARELFGDFLLDEVAASLKDPSLTNIEDELADLQLLNYCRAALKRRAKKNGTTNP